MRTPTVEIDFGGRKRHLIYDFNALAELQDLAGTYLSEAPTLKVIRAAVWAGLLAETLDERGRETADTLSIHNVGEILCDMDQSAINATVAAVIKARGIAEVPKDPTPPSEQNGPASAPNN